jgi:hypothetical protein
MVVNSLEKKPSAHFFFLKTVRIYFFFASLTPIPIGR